MLTLVAYDICAPKRLARIARVCEDYGVRVQYSIFECRLEESDFEDFWLKLLDEIDEDEDRDTVDEGAPRPPHFRNLPIDLLQQGSVIAVRNGHRAPGDSLSPEIVVIAAGLYFR